MPDTAENEMGGPPGMVRVPWLRGQHYRDTSVGEDNVGININN